MCWQTLSERFEAYQRGTYCHANACGVTECFCHAMLLGATKRARSANICQGELFLK
jgi:hypothetical protein